MVEISGRGKKRTHRQLILNTADHRVLSEHEEHPDSCAGPELSHAPDFGEGSGAVEVLLPRLGGPRARATDHLEETEDEHREHGGILYRLCLVPECGIRQLESLAVALPRCVEGGLGPCHLRDADETDGRHTGQDRVTLLIRGAWIPEVEKAAVAG